MDHDKRTELARAFRAGFDEAIRLMIAGTAPWQRERATSAFLAREEFGADTAQLEKALDQVMHPKVGRNGP